MMYWNKLPAISSAIWNVCFSESRKALNWCCPLLLHPHPSILSSHSRVVSSSLTCETHSNDAYYNFTNIYIRERTMERDYESQVLLHSSKMSSSPSLHLKLHRYSRDSISWIPYETALSTCITTILPCWTLCCIYILICYSLFFITHIFIPSREFSYHTTPLHVLYDQIRVWCCRK